MKKFIIAAILYAGFNSAALAQQANITVHGRIISFEESFPIEGVEVWVKETKNATGTQSDGTFSITLTPQDKLLVVSIAEYETQEILIDPKLKEYNIILKRENR